MAQSAIPTKDRGDHPYVDEFANEWAWRFEDGFNAVAQASHDPCDFQARLAAAWRSLGEHRVEMAEAWAAFVARKFADTIRSAPALLHEHLAQARSALPVEPDTPFLRQVDGGASVRPRHPPPQGWIAESIGSWGGLEIEVVYDPQRYDLMVTNGARGDVVDLFEAGGWHQKDNDGPRVLWTRDRQEVTQQALDRLDQGADVVERSPRQAGPGDPPPASNAGQLAL